MALSDVRSRYLFIFIFAIQRVQYARTKSDATAKLDGTWKKDKRTRQVTYAANGEATKSGKRDGDCMHITRCSDASELIIKYVSIDIPLLPKNNPVVVQGRKVVSHRKLLELAVRRRRPLQTLESLIAYYFWKTFQKLPMS